MVDCSFGGLNVALCCLRWTCLFAHVGDCCCEPIALDQVWFLERKWWNFNWLLILILLLDRKRFFDGFTGQVGLWLDVPCLNQGSVMRLNIFRMVIALVRHYVKTFQVLVRCTSTVVFESWLAVVCRKGRVRQDSREYFKFFKFLFSLLKSSLVQLCFIFLHAYFVGLLSIWHLSGFGSWGFEVNWLERIEFILDLLFEEVGFLKDFGFIVVDNDLSN